MKEDNRAWFWTLSVLPLLIACSSDNTDQKVTEQETDTGAGGLPVEMLEGTSEVLLLDDFEDGDAYNEVDGYWLTYNDSNVGGESEVWPPAVEEGGVFESDEPGYGDTGWAAHIKGTTSTTFGWDHVALMTFLGADADCPLAEPTEIDLNAYDGVQFMAKGSISGGILMFRVFHQKDGEEDNCEEGFPETLTEWADYMVEIQEELTTEWSLIRIPFEDLRQPGWATVMFPLEEVLTHAKTFTWHYEQAGGEIDFWIDNLTLYISDEEKEPEKPNLVIHPPEPPEEVEIESIEIDNPLQELAERSLNRGYNITNWIEQDDFEGFDIYNEAFVERLAENGFESLRLPIDLDRFIRDREEYFDGEADFAVTPELFEVLDAFDEWTAAHGISLTVDYHQYDESMDLEDPKDVAAAVALWSAVAEHFADNPREDLFFELLNEPEQSAGVNAVSPDTWTEAAVQIIDAIRDHDEERVIIFGDVDYYHIPMLVTRTPFSDTRMIYAFHFYDPIIFTHQGAGWSDMGTTHDIPYPYSADRWSEYASDLGFYPGEQPGWVFGELGDYYKEGNRPFLRNAIIEAKEWAVAHDVPIICNEFGVLDRTSREEDRIRYYTDVIDIFEELRIPWQHWFQVMDAETGEVDLEIGEVFGLSD